MEDKIKKFREYLMAELRFAQLYSDASHSDFEHSSFSYYEGKEDIVVSIIHEFDRLFEKELKNG
jgi:hypothetical protein